MEIVGRGGGGGGEVCKPLIQGSSAMKFALGNGTVTQKGNTLAL